MLNDWFKNSRATFQTVVKQKPILICFRSFSRALYKPQEFVFSFDWLAGMYASFVIGQSDNSCFG